MDRSLISETKRDLEGIVGRLIAAQMSLTIPLREPDWSVWGLRRSAQLWQCVALTLGFEPVYRLSSAAFVGTMGEPAPASQSSRLPDDTLAAYEEHSLLPRLVKNQAFMDRLAVAADWLGGTDADEQCRVSFAEVAGLAERMGWPMPAEFAAFAGRTQGASTEPKMPPAPAGDAESQSARQERRYRMCIDAGLPMPPDDYARLPRGIGNLAKREGITRQAFAEDMKAHIRRLNGR